MSRWIELYATSPSGKAMFVCKMCGRMTPAPTATCSQPPETYQKAPLTCQLLEELDARGVAEVKSELLRLVSRRTRRVGR